MQIPFQSETGDTSKLGILQVSITTRMFCLMFSSLSNVCLFSLCFGGMVVFPKGAIFAIDRY